MKQFLLCISILFLTLFCSAQELRVVKDNINCSYGLKDKSGNWVIEPIYILIQEYNSGYFLVKDAMGDGLLSPSGKWVYDCKYDQLLPIQPKWNLIRSYPQGRNTHPTGQGFFFQANIGDQKLLINSREKKIVAFSQLETIEFDGDAHLMVNGQIPKTCTYLDTSGNILINKLPGSMLPFGDKEFSLHGKNREPHSEVVAGDVQLINRKGESPLNERFDRAILVSKDRICFERDSKYGEISTLGTVLIEPKFRRNVRLSSAANHKGTWQIFTETDEIGLMKPDGTIVMEPIYDGLTLTHWNRELERQWLVSKDKFFGVHNDEGKMILPMIYDEITFVHGPSEKETCANFIVKKNNRFAYITHNQLTAPLKWYDGLEPVFEPDRNRGAPIGLQLITKQDEKFGILNLDGTVRSEPIYEGHSKCRFKSSGHFFWKDLEMLEYYFNIPDRKPMKWPVHFTSERTILFTDGRFYIAGNLSETYDKIVSLDPRNQNFNFLGNMMIVNRSTNSPWEIFHTKTRKKIELKNVSEITPFNNDLFLLETKENRFGILDKDGELMVNPIYLELRQNYKSTHIWASTGKNQKGKNEWVLIDQKGSQVFSDTLLETFRINSGDLIMTVNNKHGLFDSETLKWKIEPIYPCLFKSAGDFYIAAFAQNKKGILRSDGSILLALDNEAVQVFSSDAIAKTKNATTYWLVTKHGKEMLVDHKGNQLSSQASIRALKESILFGDSYLPNPFKEHDPVIELDSSLNQSDGNRLVKEPLFRSSNSYYSGVIHSFPILDYSGVLKLSQEDTGIEIHKKKQAIWSSFDLKMLAFDSLNASWNRNRVNCRDRFGRYTITVKQEKTVVREFKEDCACSKQKHFQSAGYHYGGMYHKLETIGSRFVSIAYGFHPNMDERYMTMSQPPPPPPPAQHMNFVYKNGKAISPQLNDIFQSDSVLMEEFIVALQKRDDLKLDCSNLESMLLRISRTFSLSEKGVHLYYHGFDYWSNQAIEFIVPIERLEARVESRWIVPILTSTD